jgi:hypothetical protein
VIGVLQLINKVSGNYVFTQQDEDVMNIFLSIGGPILAASNLYQQLQGKGNKKSKYYFNLLMMLYIIPYVMSQRAKSRSCRRGPQVTRLT